MPTTTTGLEQLKTQAQAAKQTYQQARDRASEQVGYTAKRQEIEAKYGSTGKARHKALVKLRPLLREIDKLTRAEEAAYAKATKSYLIARTREAGREPSAWMRDIPTTVAGLTYRTEVKKQIEKLEAKGATDVLQRLARQEGIVGQRAKAALSRVRKKQAEAKVATPTKPTPQPEKVPGIEISPKLGQQFRGGKVAEVSPEGLVSVSTPAGGKLWFMPTTTGEYIQTGPTGIPHGITVTPALAGKVITSIDKTPEGYSLQALEVGQVNVIRDIKSGKLIKDPKTGNYYRKDEIEKLTLDPEVALRWFNEGGLARIDKELILTRITPTEEPTTEPPPQAQIKPAPAPIVKPPTTNEWWKKVKEAGGEGLSGTEFAKFLKDNPDLAWEGRHTIIPALKERGKNSLAAYFVERASEIDFSGIDWKEKQQRLKELAESMPLIQVPPISEKEKKEVSILGEKAQELVKSTWDSLPDAQKKKLAPLLIIGTMATPIPEEWIVIPTIIGAMGVAAFGLSKVDLSLPKLNRTYKQYTEATGQEPTTDDIVIVASPGAVTTMSSIGDLTKIVPPRPLSEEVQKILSPKAGIRAGARFRIEAPTQETLLDVPPGTIPSSTPPLDIGAAPSPVVLLPNPRPKSQMRSARDNYLTASSSLAATERQLRASVQTIPIDYDKILRDIQLEKIFTDIQRQLEEANAPEGERRRHSTLSEEYLRRKEALEAARKSYIDSLNPQPIGRNKLTKAALQTYADFVLVQLIATDNLTKALSQTQNITQAVTQAYPETLAQARTAVQSNIAPKTVTLEATQSAIRSLTRTQVITSTQARTATRALARVAAQTLALTRTAINIKPVPIPIPPPKISLASGKEVTTDIIPGTITWRQGLFWKLLPPPYKQEDLQTLKKPPAGAYRLATGKDSAYKTIQIIGGLPPNDAEVDIGTMIVHIRKKDKKVDIDFKRDPKDIYKGKPVKLQKPKEPRLSLRDNGHKRLKAGKGIPSRTYLGRKIRDRDLGAIVL